MAREILSAVFVRGRSFRTDSSKEEKETLNSLLTPDAAESLVERGVLGGEWSGNKKAADADASVTVSPGPARPGGVKREYGKDAEGGESDREVAGGALPSGFPARAVLVKAGFDTGEKVDEASDEDLLALEDLGDATLKKIREARS